MLSLRLHSSILAGILLSLFFWISPAFAGKIAVPRRHFSVEVRGKYGTQWSKIFKDGPKWACQTDDMPYSEVTGDPFTELDWQKLSKEAKEKRPACRDEVRIIDSRTLPAKSITTCLTLPGAKHWVDHVNHACGR